MSLEITERTVLDRRNGLLGWSVGLIAYVVLLASLFPTIRDSAGFAEAMEDYPDALKELLGGDAALDITSGPGFLNAELYTLMLPLLLVVVAIGMGASLASDQQRSMTDLILATHVSRRRLIAERCVAMAVALTGLAALVVASILVAEPIVSLEVSTSNLLAATVAVGLLVLLHGLVALGVAAATGSRGTAIGVATALFAAGYVATIFGGLISWLEPTRALSPYHHALGSNPLVNGWALGHLAILAGACAVTGAATVAVFEQRDLR